LFTSADGGSLYAQHRTLWGDFSFKFNVGIALGDHEEIKAAFLGSAAKGEFVPEAAIATRLKYELNGGEYVLAVSYVDLTLKYNPSSNDFIAPGSTRIQPLVFSAQYNGGKFGLTAEYFYRWNASKDYDVIPDHKSISESWYIQGSYRFMPQLQGIVRYETLSQSIDDRSGNRAASFGLPNHIAYSKDWMVGLRWDVTS
jgi:predicted porin